MNIRHSLSLLALATLTAASAYAGPASKFAAHVAQAGENLHLLYSGKDAAEESGTRVEKMNEDPILNATIKTANKSDLLVGVSLQIGLYTDTTVKGKNGSSETAAAEGAVEVWVKVDGGAIPAYPNKVVFARRFQKLNAILGGVIESCNVTVTDTDGVLEGEILVARDCTVNDESIGLILDTTSANHFNFVIRDLTPGDHTIEVIAKAMSSAEFENGSYCPVTRDENGLCPEPEVTTKNEAQGYAVIDVGTLTVEEVRAINQEGGIVIDGNAGCYDADGNYVCPQ